MSNLKNEIKLLLLNSDMTMTELVNKLNEKHGRSDSIQNLNNKLTKETIKYTEILEIADILGYELEWIKVRNDETIIDETNYPEMMNRLEERLRQLMEVQRSLEQDTSSIGAAILEAKQRIVKPSMAAESNATYDSNSGQK